MRKKFTLLVFGLLALFSLAACSKNDPTTPPSSNGNAGSSSEVTIPADATESQKAAIQSAQEVLYFGTWSEFSLKRQLTSMENSFSEEDVDYALDVLKIDWNEQALESAKFTLKSVPYSEAGLKENLTDEDFGFGFTEEQASYAMKQLNYSESDWNKEAVKALKEALSKSPRSEELQRDHMISIQKFTEKQTEYAIKKVKPNWNDQAVAVAKVYQSSNMSKDDIKKVLVSEKEKFTEEQAQYAVDHLGD